MYHRKLTADESLQEILLRMKYDSKKTLSENTKVLEQSVVGAPNYGMITSTEPTTSTKSAISSIGSAVEAGVANSADTLGAAIDKLNQKNPTPPSDLKDVKHFQDWLDKNVSSIITTITNNEWAWSPRQKRYYKVESNPKRGYGRFGPSTQRMWNDAKVKEEYLKSLQGGETKPPQDTTITPPSSTETDTKSNEVNKAPNVDTTAGENKPVVQVKSPQEWLED